METRLPEFVEAADAPDGSSTGVWLTSFLYPRPAERTAGSILRWWEKRRLAYNTIVGASGLVTVTILSLLTSPFGADGRSLDILIPIFVYGTMANICFSFGSVIEVLFQKIWGKDVLPVGPALWRSGLIFSVGLTLVFPMIIMVTGMVLSFIGGLL